VTGRTRRNADARISAAMAQGVDDEDRRAWFEFGSLAELVGHDRRGPRHEDDLVAAHVGYDNLLRASGPCGTRHRAVSHRAVNGRRCAHGARPRTGSSNPSPSSGESIANLTPSVLLLLPVPGRRP
jgi:hypothetical protein